MTSANIFDTGEVTWPSNQKQIIEQAKFTYHPLGKSYQKQIKTIEDQGEKQMEVIQNQGEIKIIIKYGFNRKDIPLVSKQKEIFNKLVDKTLDEITKSDKKS